MALVIIIVLAMILFLYSAIPLLFPKQADPLPDLRDPVTSDLEEERDALIRAIKELDARSDLDPERRGQLRSRYEAKTAKVLRKLDEQQQLTPPSRPKASRRVPFAALSLLALMMLSATLLGGYVLPRFGPNASVTTGLKDDLARAQTMAKLEKAAKAEPSLENLLALADAYWQQGDALQDEMLISKARASYQQIFDELNPIPAIVYFRLGILNFPDDPEASLAKLAEAARLEPQEPSYLYYLATAYGTLGYGQEAIKAWENYLALPEAKDDSEAMASYERLKNIVPLVEAAQKDENETTLMALADAFWDSDDRDNALSAYLQVLTNYNRDNSRALSRSGQAFFFNNNTPEAIALLEKARELELAQGKPELNTLLFLGNAYFSVDNLERAIGAWEEYISAAGGEDKAGRVPSLIANAQARLNGEDVPAITTTPLPTASANTTFSTDALVVGQELYTQRCSGCHGINGQGGAGARLAGNARLSDLARTSSIIRNGMGMMPAYEVLLSAAEIESLARYLEEAFAP